MDSTTRAELASLRSRAYGPSADIDRDPDARQRLSELEALARDPVANPRVGTDPSPEPASPPLPLPTARAEADHAPVEPIPRVADRPAAADLDPPPARDRRNPRKRSRLHWLLWGGSIVAAATIAAAITYGVVRIFPVAVSSGAPQIATLEPDALLRIPPGWFGAGASSAVYEFYGLTLFETSGDYYGRGGNCLAIVLSTDVPADQNAGQDSWSMSGPSYTGCRVGSFPAAVSVAVTSDSPPELRARYPDGALQFVKDDDRIGVFFDGGASD